MFPNPQDALPFPPHPDLDQYKKRAKDLLRASQSPDPTALRVWAATWIDSLVRLSDLTIPPQIPVRIDHWTDQLENFAHKQLTENRILSAAQFVIARAHGFESWPKLAKHLESIALANSPIDHFEQCVDAIVAGDVATLERLLREHPDLIRAHSTRRHQAMLLHYVSANAVEGYRQKTPKNIVQITELLLKTGAVVNAVADVYGGSTTLGLVATSVHPERAGVQEALMQLLLDHGAFIDAANPPGPSLVSTCLANGRARAAEFLAQRGATLALEAAAGLGRLEAVRKILENDPPGNLAGQRIERAMLWACEYGRNDVVDFLLQRGVSSQAQANTGQTALHWAVIGGQLDTIKLLLTHGAQLEAQNFYGGTALGQALWSALNGDPNIDYVAVLKLLLNSGAQIEEGTIEWLVQQKPESPTKARITELLRSQPRPAPKRGTRKPGTTLPVEN
jgi:hypothetical protein